MLIEQNEYIFALMSLRLTLMIVCFLVINSKKCNNFHEKVIQDQRKVLQSKFVLP